jgi:hypothetical protein
MWYGQRMYNECNYKVFHVKRFVAAEVYVCMYKYDYEEEAKAG